MVVPTPRTPVRQGRSVNERLELLELRQWVAPERLAGVLSGITDANEVDGTGSFFVSAVRVGFPVATLNSPDPAQNYVIDQYELDSGSRYQIANRIGSPASQIFTERWARTRTAGGTWTDWVVLSLPSKSFAPALGSGLTLGNGIMAGTYSVADGILFGRITLAIGSTTVIGSSITFGHPPIPYVGGSTRTAGQSRMTDASTGVVYPGVVLVNNALLYVRVSGAPAGETGAVVQREYTTSPNVPFTWATGDNLILDFDYAIL